jgi:hypothetical protein
MHTTTEACSVCGNTYDRMIHVEQDGKQGVFDCFECAVYAFAPTCRHCGVRVMGHGVESNGLVFCCASCARHDGVYGLRDRA